MIERIRSSIVRTSTLLVAAAALAAPATASAAPAASTAPAAVASAQPLSPVPSLDVDRYVGRWYQVAALPQIYTLQCWSDTTATYARVDADTISVRNDCRTATGRQSSVTGHADVLDPTTNAQLRVTFDGIPSFGDRTAPNYVVTALADDYSLALVGDPARRSGFVLSRTPALTSTQWATVRAAVRAAGYQEWTFWTTPQAGGEHLPRLLSTVR